jgi:hypothetical protein
VKLWQLITLAAITLILLVLFVWFGFEAFGIES